MKNAGIICEYNPFHLGHRYQLQKTASPDGIKTNAIIAVMSGNFTQRGEAAVLSKYQRAEIAVRNGADLVLELPFPYSSASAEIFGEAGVAILHALGCVDTLCFGSETGDLSHLQTISDHLCSDEFDAALTAYLSQNPNQTYRMSVREVYRMLYGDSFSEGSNDILSLSYLNALKKHRSTIVPMTVKRKGERYNGAGEGFASATSVRAYLQAGDFEKIKASVPNETADALLCAFQNGRLALPERIYPLFATLVRTRGKAVFENIYDVSNELAARLLKFAYARTMTEFLTLCASKNDSPSRIRRAMLSVLMNVRKEDVTQVPYTTVLAANGVGRAILKDIRKTAGIPIVTKPADAEKYGEAAAQAFALSARADSVWELLTENGDVGYRSLLEKPIMLD